MHIDNLFDLSGRCAVVIGGAGTVGFPMAEALAEAGAKVYIASRSAKNFQPIVENLKSNGLDVCGVELDQSDESSVIRALDFIMEDFKVPHILINSGCHRPMTKFYSDSIDNWDLSMNINARGLFITCRVFGNAMALLERGSIINISSIYGMVAPDMGIYEGVDFETEPDYPFLKGAVISYSKYLSSLYSKKNVRVNCISPGGVFNNQPSEFLDNYVRRVPLGRLANPSDMKGAALFLASDASSYITGATVPVDGGWTAI